MTTTAGNMAWYATLLLMISREENHTKSPRLYLVRVVLIDITVMHSMYMYVPLDGIVHLSELTLISKKATYNLLCALFRESIVN